LIPASETCIIASMSSIDLERRGAVAVVTLNNPDARNALDLDMRRALLATVRDLAEQDEVRAVLLTGDRRCVLLRSRRRQDGRTRLGGLAPADEDDARDDPRRSRPRQTGGGRGPRAGGGHRLQPRHGL
jgi:hypothetical protein